jgi:hypothetical protein
MAFVVLFRSCKLVFASLHHALQWENAEGHVSVCYARNCRVHQVVRNQVHVALDCLQVMEY